MGHPSSEEENTVKDVRNLFRLEKKQLIPQLKT